MRYQTPKEFYYRLHHVRPRFKNNIENVLIYMATELAKIGKKDEDTFAEEMNSAVRRFPGNATLNIKTINNWRTEISALFAFIQTDGGLSWAGRRATELADQQDLVHAFKVFLYDFQYPGGHIKPHENVKDIRAGIRFKPAQFLLRLLDYAEKKEGRRIYITAAELTHCVYNDLRCTRGTENIEVTWSRIKHNREHKVSYDWTGDVIRYAGDILDYMEIAGLLVVHGPDCYINKNENVAVLKFIESSNWFDAYDPYIGQEETTPEDIKALQSEWFEYANKPRADDFFKTNVLALIAESEQDYRELQKNVAASLHDRVENGEEVRTKEIGDMGENLVHGHECSRLKSGNRQDLVHLVKIIPNHLCVGYDINSREFDATSRFIEVKTTVSCKELNFYKCHLTSNEWKSAESNNSRYFVYRLLLSKHQRKLFIMSDPVGKYKADIIQATPRGDGMDISFNPSTSGEYMELLEWVS